jgi:hypothetical protein
MAFRANHEYQYSKQYEQNGKDLADIYTLHKYRAETDNENAMYRRYMKRYEQGSERLKAVKEGERKRR